MMSKFRAQPTVVPILTGSRGTRGQMTAGEEIDSIQIVHICRGEIKQINSRPV